MRKAATMSWDEEAYKSLTDYCHRIGVEPQSFESWYIKASGVSNPTINRSHAQFHKHEATDDVDLKIVDYIPPGTVPVTDPESWYQGYYEMDGF
jgi:hypothetical protein